MKVEFIRCWRDGSWDRDIVVIKESELGYEESPEEAAVTWWWGWYYSDKQRMQRLQDIVHVGVLTFFPEDPDEIPA